jgi:hypothetical protein
VECGFASGLHGIELMTVDADKLAGFTVGNDLVGSLEHDLIGPAGPER